MLDHRNCIRCYLSPVGFPSRPGAQAAERIKDLNQQSQSSFEQMVMIAVLYEHLLLRIQ